MKVRITNNYSLSYLKLHKELTIPVRLSINLQKHTKSEFFKSAINIQNNTRLIKLIKFKKVYLSNNQIRIILTKFKDELIKLLIVESIDVLKLKNERIKNKDSLSFVLSKDNWKIRVLIKQSWLDSLRNGYYDDELVIRKPKEAVIPEKEEEEDIIQDTIQDTKFKQSFSYHKVSALNTPLEIEVLQVSR